MGKRKKKDQKIRRDKIKQDKRCKKKIKWRKGTKKQRKKQ